MKANELMKRNIDALLHARHQQRKDLAVWCRRGESWISKIMKEDRREFPMKYWDRIADFFGIATYQLLQPGISPLTERRKGGDRRSGQDRRKSAINHRVRETVSSAIATLTPEDVADLLRLKSMDAEKRAGARDVIEAIARSGPQTGARGRGRPRAGTDVGEATRRPSRGNRPRHVTPPKPPPKDE